MQKIKPEEISRLFLIDLKKLVKRYEKKYSTKINYLQFKNK
jgi:hypothetical protein